MMRLPESKVNGDVTMTNTVGSLMSALQTQTKPSSGLPLAQPSHLRRPAARPAVQNRPVKPPSTSSRLGHSSVPRHNYAPGIDFSRHLQVQSDWNQRQHQRQFQVELEKRRQYEHALQQQIVQSQIQSQQLQQLTIQQQQQLLQQQQQARLLCLSFNLP